MNAARAAQTVESATQPMLVLVTENHCEHGLEPEWCVVCHPSVCKWCQAGKASGAHKR